LILAIDTSTRFMSIALHDGARLHFESTWHSANNHTIELAPAIMRAFDQANSQATDLQAVAIAQGPGSFTGLRIGMGVAKGLALANGIPLVAVPTLAIVAAGVPLTTGLLVAVLQAGRGRICAQSFIAGDKDWTPVGAATITTWADVITGIERSAHIAGEIDKTGFELLERAGLSSRVLPAAQRLRRAGFLAEIAWEKIQTGYGDDPFHVTPIYLHQPGAAHP